MLDTKRDNFKSLLTKTGEIFSNLPITPNQYTIMSIFFSLFAALFIVQKFFILALIFFIIAAFLDSIDGSVARCRHQECKAGAYADTIIDRYVEGITLFAFLFLSMPVIFFEPYVWIFLTLFGSMATTYSKAAAKEKDLVKEELKGGLFSRGERLITISLMIFLAIIDNSFYSSMVVMVIMSFLVNITAIQRIIKAFKINNKESC